MEKAIKIPVNRLLNCPLDFITEITAVVVDELKRYSPKKGRFF